MTDEREGLPSASDERLEPCPGSWSMCQGLPQEPPSEDALFGTHVHQFLAGIIPANVLTAEEFECAEMVRAREAKILEACGITGKEPCEREVRLWLYHFRDGQKVMSGQPDIVYYRKDRALIIDDKTGHKQVAGNSLNRQLRRLAVLVRRNMGVPEVWVAIAQPWAKEQAPCRYTADDLDKAEAEIFATLEATQSVNAPRRPGEWCRYCRARGIYPERVCPEANYVALTTAKADTRLALYSPEEIAKVKIACEFVTKILAPAVDTNLKTRLSQDPKSVPGWTLEPGDERREINSVPKAWSILRQTLLDVEIAESCKIALGKLEKVYRTHYKSTHPKATNDECDLALEQLLEGCITKKQNAPSLVQIKQ